MKAQKGVTLIETVMVFCIIAIVAAIAVPQFRKMAVNGNLKAAAKDIMGDFSYMRERAISENTSFAINLNQTSNNYTIPYPGGQIKTPAHFSSDILITGISFAGGGTTLTFQARGTVYPPGTSMLELTNGRGSKATITLLTAGRIYVQYLLQ